MYNCLLEPDMKLNSTRPRTPCSQPRLVASHQLSSQVEYMQMFMHGISAFMQETMRDASIVSVAVDE